MRPDEQQTNASWAGHLYDRCAADLLLYGRALGLGTAEAEDVLHDTFKAMLQLAEEPEEPRFYLLRSFRNRALNHRRSLWRRLKRELESISWFEPSEEPSPQERAATEALRRLPQDQREVIVLKLWHNLTFEAIGSLLEVSPNTVAGRYRYGLQKLKNWLTDPAHESLGTDREPAAWAPSPATLTDHQARPV